MSISLLNSASKIPLRSLIALVGPEAYVRHEVREHLVKRALGAALKDMNYGHFQAGEDEISKILDACRDYPCFAEKRVVVISEASAFKKKDAAELLAYFQNPVPSTVLIVEDEKLDGRLDWVKVLKKHSEYIEIAEAQPEECLDWVRRCFAKEGKGAESEVVARIVEWVGNSLSALQLTVAQLCLYGGERPEVCLEDVESLLVKVSEENIFKVIDGIFSGDVAELHRSLQALLEAGEAPLKILALLYRHLSILLVLKFDGGSDASSLFRLGPMVRRLYERQARQYAGRLNFSLLAPIAQADVRLKSSNLPNELLLQHCVGNIIDLLAKG